MSLPTWERGLKFNVMESEQFRDWVAPYVGAWIEIEFIMLADDLRVSLPTWERGLKSEEQHDFVPELCRSLRGSVD